MAEMWSGRQLQAVPGCAAGGKGRGERQGIVSELSHSCVPMLSDFMLLFLLVSCVPNPFDRHLDFTLDVCEGARQCNAK